jgi:hypothetical protein
VKGAEEQDVGVMMCRGGGGGSYDSKGIDTALERRVIWVREGRNIRWGSMSIVFGYGDWILGSVGVPRSGKALCLIGFFSKVSLYLISVYTP